MDIGMNSDMNLSEAMRIARDPAARKHLESLRKSNSKELEAVLHYAACGNYAEAQNNLKELLTTPEMLAFLEHLGGRNGRT